MADVIWAQLKIDTDQSKKAVTSLNSEIRRTGELSKSTGNAGYTAFNKHAHGVENAVKAQRKLQVESKKTVGGFTDMVGSLKGLAGAMGIAFGVQQIIAFTKAAITAASDLNETVSKTGELFGDSTQAVINWSKGTAQSIGQSSQQALDGAANFAIFGRAAGLSGTKLVDFSTDFVQLASDLASFNNTSPEEAINAIGAALRGEAEPIRRYGILLDDATLRQEALTLGIIKNVKTALTPQQRVLAAQAAIYKQTSAAQGDFERTSDGLANQQRILNAEWENMKAKLGVELLPIVLDFVGTLNGLLNQDFDKFSKSFGKLYREIVPFGILLNQIEKATGEATIKFTDFEKTQLQIINATDAEVKALIEQNKAVGYSTAAMEKFIQTARDNAVKDTFVELAKALEITADQYARLVSISDQYGISSRINSSLILDIKQSTEEDLNNAYLKFNKTLGVSKKDWDDYIGLVKEIPPIQEDVKKSTGKLIGPYEQLTKAVSDTLSKLQDMSALALRGLPLDQLGAKADVLKEAQFRLALANNLVTVSIGDYKKELEDLSLFMNTDGKFIFSIPGNNDEEILKLFEGYRKTQEGLKELADQRDQARKQEEGLIKKSNDEKLKLEEEYLAKKKELEERHLAEEAEAQEILQSLGLRQVDEFSKNMNAIAEARKLGLITDQEYWDAKVILESENFAKLAGALSSTIGSIGDSIANLFGEAAKDSVEFMAFQKIITLAEIALASAQAIASGIASITKGDPLSVFTGIAQLISGITAIISGLTSSVQSIPVPDAPAFAEGTGYVKRGNNPPGVDTVPAWLTEGEGVVKKSANAKYPGLVDALNMGVGESAIMKFAAPVLRKMAEEKEIETAERIAASIALQMGFDDYRLFRTIVEGNNINKSGFIELSNALKRRNKKRGGYA